VADTAEPNAFALPGGYVYVSRGLLAITNSEDELATRDRPRGRPPRREPGDARGAARGLTGLGAAVTGIVSPTLSDVVGGIGGLAGALVVAPYSRGQEHEADRLGQEFAAGAGWIAALDGETLAQLFDRADATAWDPDMAAVANGVVASAPLPRGQLVKVARSEPYRPR